MPADPLFDRLARALADRYTLERELGRGGMATVYLGTDLKLERRVAIKALAPTTRAYLGSDRFQREVLLAAQLSHPHIVPLFEADEADGILFYVMEYVEGESLRDRLMREGPLPVAHALRIAAEVGDAPQYARVSGRAPVHRAQRASDCGPRARRCAAGHPYRAPGTAGAPGRGARARFGETAGRPPANRPNVRRVSRRPGA